MLRARLTSNALGNSVAFRARARGIAPAASCAPEWAPAGGGHCSFRSAFRSESEFSDLLMTDLACRSSRAHVTASGKRQETGRCAEAHDLFARLIHRLEDGLTDLRTPTRLNRTKKWQDVDSLGTCGASVIQPTQHCANAAYRIRIVLEPLEQSRPYSEVQTTASMLECARTGRRDRDPAGQRR